MKRITLAHILIGIALIACIGLLGYRILSNKSAAEAPETNTSTAQIVKEVSLLAVETIQEKSFIETIGEVEALEQVSLKSEVSGQITSVSVTLGQTVRKGQVLFRVDNSGLLAQRGQAQAGLQSAIAGYEQASYGVDAARIRLQEVERGARQEELNIARASVSQAEQAVVNAEKAEEETRISAANQLQSAINTGIDGIYVVTEIQYAHFLDNRQDSNSIRNAKRNAVNVLLGEKNAGQWVNEYISTLSGGAKASVALAQSDSSEIHVRKAIQDTLLGLRAVETALSAIPINDDILAAQQANISGQKVLLVRKLHRLQVWMFN